jgi:small subunit ribosomal protein S21
MAEVKKRENESLDDMLRRFRKEVEKDKILEDYRKHEIYTPKTKKKRKK